MTVLDVDAVTQFLYGNGQGLDQFAGIVAERVNGGTDTAQDEQD